MIAMIERAWARLADGWNFAVMVWLDARAMQREAEARYGLGGF